MTQLLNYSVGLQMSRESIENRLSAINGKVEEVRYICLIKKLKSIYNYCNYFNTGNTQQHPKKRINRHFSEVRSLVNKHL